MVVKFNGNITSLNPSDGMSLNKSIGALIRDLRNKKKISGEVLSGFICVSQQQISRYERGETGLTLGKLQEIAHFFGLSIWQFTDLLCSHYIQCSGSPAVRRTAAGEPGE